MESSQARRVATDALNFAIATEPLQAIGGSQIFQTDKYLAIYGKGLLLGIKPQKECAQLILNHYQAYQLGYSLFEEVFCPGADRVCFLSEDQSWMASLIGEDSNEGMCFDEYQQDLFPPTKCIRRDEWANELHQHGFRPSLGVVNGFDHNDNLAFYLLVEPIDHETSSIPVLTLASFKFSEQQQHEIALQPPNRREAHALALLQEKAQPVFSEALNEFLALYRQLSQWTLDQQSLTAISLDLYNKNRNTASIAVDPQLASELRRFIFAANEHYQNQTRMSSIVDFIMRYNEFDFNAAHFYRTKIEQLFVRKRSYQKMARVLTQNDPSSSGFERYLGEQLRSYQDTFVAVG